ncbi:uncharacterized protein PSFLO_06155 [Pseudozyma flocculosa]|uniref:SAM domain-containing protein n=1 Tax=Pseudozyma flocculosa TaxID=84751 RepID=A0A5C3F891_9BASI|nr:uncharacterized protein PSFLO_06155 [Pseudozyma flocculosa]
MSGPAVAVAVAAQAQPPRPAVGISTPSRPRPSVSRNDSLPASANPSAPASAPPDGYSYLARSTSISTPTRSRPQGLSSKSSNSNLASPVLANRPSLTDLKHAAAAPTSPSAAAAPRRDLSRRKTMHGMPASMSLPQLTATATATATAAATAAPAIDEASRIAEAVSKLPANPRGWTPSQVALYLTHVLGLVPRPVVEDVTAYVRSSRMGGRAFLRLSEKDLELQGLNLKWRRLMIEAVRKLRRDALRGRIWGNESGSVKWPRKHDHEFEPESPERAEDGDGDDDGLGDAAVTKDGVVRSSKGVSKLTLKRMRDSKKVQGMIQAFQLSPRSQAKMGLSAQDLAALGIDQIRKGHVATRGGSNGSDDAGGSPRAQIPPIFGEGYVRDQAESYESASDAEPTADVKLSRSRTLSAAGRGKGDTFDDLLACVSDQEAAELASELDLEDLRDPDRFGSLSSLSSRSDIKAAMRSSSGFDTDVDVALVPCLDRDPPGTRKRGVSDASASASLSSATSDSEMEMEDLLRMQQTESRFSLLDADVIKSIMGEPSTDDVEPAQAGGNEDEPAASGGLTRSRTTGSIARPERPYRASLYTTEELLLLDSVDSASSHHPRTESSAELAGALGLETDEHPFLASPKFDTAKKRPVSTSAAASASGQETTRIDGLFSAAQAPAAAADEYIFDPPAATLAPVRSQPASVRKKMSGTYGSKRGKALLSMLQNATDENDPSLLDLGAQSAGNGAVGGGGGGSHLGSVRMRKKGSRQGIAGGAAAAEDEEGWGGTLSRPASRKSLSSIYMGGEEGAAAAAAAAIPAASTGRGSVASRMGSTAVRRRPLERVASEAEAEAWHEAQEQALARLNAEAGDAAEAVKPLERYEETTAVDDEQQRSVSQKPSVERRLTDLFAGHGSSGQEDEEEGVAAADAAPSADEVVEVAPAARAPEEAPEEAPEVAADESEATAEDAIEAPPSYDDGSASISTETEAAVEPAPLVQAQLGETTTTAQVPSGMAASSATADEVDASATEDESDDAQLLVPLTTLTPHPSGTGSIRKRSMVLVDRKRFESLARKMEALENQITSLEAQQHEQQQQKQLAATLPGQAAKSGLRDLFSPTSPAFEEGQGGEGSEDEAVVVVEQPVRQDDERGEEGKATSRFSLLHPSSWTRYLSSLNPYYSSSSSSSHSPSSSSYPCAEGEEEDETERSPDEERDHALSLGAIPAYMLGLGAGVGFVVVKEVVGLGLSRR